MTSKLKLPTSICLVSLAFVMLAGRAEAEAKIRVVTTLPEIALIAREIGGDRVQASSLLTGTEDAHYLDAVPSFIRAVSDADVVCAMGLELEIGWLPRVLSRSGNSKVQTGGPGFCEIGPQVTVLEKPTGIVDRSMGDVHAQGNPHFNLSPKALAQGAASVAAALKRVDPDGAEVYEKGLKAFQARMETLRESISARFKAASIDKLRVIQYHREFTYFFDVYGLPTAGSIEEKPGVPPSASRLASVSSSAKASNVRLALAASFSPERQLQRFSELSGVPFKRVPHMVQVSNEKLDSIEEVQNALADALISRSKEVAP